MCSVSWLTSEDGYQVFFNRDDQRTRAIALPPQQFNIEGVEVLMPIDPVGEGSWISMNEYGLSLCLLNNYQDRASQGTLISRGQLLKQLSIFKSVAEVSKAFKTIELDYFAPFTLLAFDPKLSIDNLDVIAFSWNGESSQIFPTDSPLFSSSVDPEKVQAYRKKTYESYTKEEKSLASLLKFHTHHHPVHSYMSPCMSREDAKTLSFTYLSVSSVKKSMAYIPGSPCQNLTEESLTSHSFQITSTETFVS